jgi:hypothetical protein
MQGHNHLLGWDMSTTPEPLLDVGVRLEGHLPLVWSLACSFVEWRG